MKGEAGGTGGIKRLDWKTSKAGSRYGGQAAEDKRKLNMVWFGRKRKRDRQCREGKQSSKTGREDRHSD
jgi:hypothetical protein